MQEFLEDPFLILLFSYYALMTFLMTLTLILLSVLIMVVEHESYLQNAIDLWGIGLLILMLEKLNLFRLTGLITLVM